MTTTVDETGRRVEETPLVVTSQVGDEVVPPKAERGDTTYVVLSLTVDGEQESWSVEEEAMEARSAEAAVRKFAESVTAEALADGITAVAIPSRSWKPVRIMPKTVTTLEISGA